jgi:hypothetical protein
MTLSPSTKFSATVVSIFSGATMIACGSWYTANTLRDITDEIRQLRREVRQANADHWTAYDMERWARQLEKVNQPRGLVVPEISARQSSASVP